MNYLYPTYEIKSTLKTTETEASLAKKSCKPDETSERVYIYQNVWKNQSCN